MPPILGRVASSTLSRVLLCGVLLVGTLAQGAWAQAPQPIETTMQAMLAALQTRSLKDFVAGGDATFQAAMTQSMLESVSAQFGPRLKQGYTATYLSRLNQEGFEVYLWKLEFKDGQDDRLITMVVIDGKVKGFFLR